MYLPLFERLYKEGLVSADSVKKIGQHPRNTLVSVHWELKLLLYLGVLLFSGGLGVLVYKHIDTIGHQFILAFIGLLCGAGFFYCNKYKTPFTSLKSESPNVFFDYALLLSCLLLLTFVAYFQYQYNVFGNRFGLAVFCPMLVLFFCAYYFDHLGVLSLAITNLGAWLGITVTPLHILKQFDFNGDQIIYTAMGLGILLISASVLTDRRNFKKHFAFTYLNFGMHLLFISCLSALFYFESMYPFWFIGLAAITYFFYRKALADKSFYILLVSLLYFYVGFSYMVIRLLDRMQDLGILLLYMGFIYFILSAVGLVIFLMRMNKKMKANDHL